MKYRGLGRSGITVSEIGLGGHRDGVETRGGIERTARFFEPDQQRAAVVGRAIDAGVSYFETTYYCEIESLGRSLRLLNRRDGLFVSGMRVDFFANFLHESIDVRAYVRREVEACLQAFGFDHVDQFICGAMEQGDPAGHRAQMEDALDEFAKLRQQGKLRLIGFSTHSPNYADRLLDTFPAFDTAMTPYSFANREAEGDLAAALERHKAAWVAMKTLVWHIYGVPVTVLRNLPSLKLRNAPIGRLALQWVLGNPLVSTCVPAMNSIAAVEENVAASGEPICDRELQTLTECATAMKADDFVPLAIAGLFERNGRVLANALGLLDQRLKLNLPGIDWAADDAQDRAIRLADDVLARLRRDPKWGALLEA